MCLSSSSSHTEQLRVQAWGTPAGAGWLGWLRGAPAPGPLGGCASALGAEAPGISLTRWDRPL